MSDILTEPHKLIPYEELIEICSSQGVWIERLQKQVNSNQELTDFLFDAFCEMCRTHESLKKLWWDNRKELALRHNRLFTQRVKDIEIQMDSHTNLLPNLIKRINTLEGTKPTKIKSRYD